MPAAVVSTTRIQETLIAFSRAKQADIATPNTAAGMWRLHKVNASLVNPRLNTENDAEKLGKGHEFATTLYPTFYPGSGFQAWAGKTFTVDAGTDVFTCTGHGLQNGAHVTVSGADLPAGLTAGVVYHVIAATTDTLQLSLTEGGDAVLMSDAGTPPHTMTVVPATTGAIRGRLEYGNRSGTLKFVARFMSGSTELAKLRSQTTGTAVLTLTYDTNNSLSITWHKVAFALVDVGETDGILTVSVECTPMYHSANGLITAVAKCDVDGIGEAEA
jgi:hypothetical protein